TAFTVTSGGAAVAVNAVAVDAAAKIVTLTLASAISHGQAVTVAYADPTAGDDANAIQDGAGNDAMSLLPTAVSNTTPTPPQPPTTPTVVKTVSPFGETLLKGTSGNDVLTGGPGTNVLEVGARSADVTLTRNSDGSVTLTGPGLGTDKLVNIDILRFNDRAELLNPPKGPISTGAAPFDEATYLAQNSDVAAAVKRGEFTSGEAHFKAFGKAEGRMPDVAVDASYYLAHNKDVADAVARGEFKSALDHFLRFGEKEGRAPNVLFNEKFYLVRNPDVAAALKAGTLSNAYEHYQQYGWKEGRDPSAFLNTTAYLEANRDVAAAKVNPLDHFLDYGALEGRSLKIADTGYWQS
ncbi:SwmB domain-containing protein, partial [Aureimonas ureilytica]|uniref:SwmB domain-containing protein n=1 Tax=Aureimonas ureilytica TaxID=401562 RepID=UPI002377FDDA